MVRTVKIALELELTNPLHMAIFQTIANNLSVVEANQTAVPKQVVTESKSVAEATKQEAPKVVAESPKAVVDDKEELPKEQKPEVPTATRAEVISLTGKLLMHKTKGKDFADKGHAWLSERGYEGKVPRMPDELLSEFYAFAKTFE